MKKHHNQYEEPDLAPMITKLCRTVEADEVDGRVVKFFEAYDMTQL